MKVKLFFYLCTLLLFQAGVPSNCILVQTKSAEAGIKIKLLNGDQVYKFDEQPQLNLERLKSITVDKGPMQLTTIKMVFDDQGRETLKKISTSAVGNQIGVILDEKLIAAPKVKQPIENGILEIMVNVDYDQCLKMVRKHFSRISN